MSEFAYEVPDEDPRPDLVPGGDTDRGDGECRLCGAPMAAGEERCPECGLWAGGRENPISRRVLFRAALVFVTLYLVALAVVAVAR